MFFNSTGFNHLGLQSEHNNWMSSHRLRNINDCSGRSRISRGKGAPSLDSSMPTYFAIFCRKLHENERIWTESLAAPRSTTGMFSFINLSIKPHPEWFGWKYCLLIFHNLPFKGSHHNVPCWWNEEPPEEQLRVPDSTFYWCHYSSSFYIKCVFYGDTV